MYRARFTALLCSAFVASLATTVGAQDSRQNTPGEFDFYVLSLSWSPSFCEAGTERNAARGAERGADRPARRAPDQQCGERPYAFVVHGLWPQYEAGFPEFCKIPAPRLDRNIVNSMLDLMPAPQLVYHEWDRHGTCAGLSARAYFDTVRKARAVVKIPNDYLDLKAPLTVTPDQVEDAFLQANPGLTRGAVAVGCDNRRLREVRICLTKELGFRDCAEIDARACRREQLVMPPVRGATTGSARD